MNIILQVPIVTTECFVFRKYYVTSATGGEEIRETVIAKTGSNLSPTNHLPKLMSRFITEHPELELEKSRSIAGMTYRGMALRCLSEASRRNSNRDQVVQMPTVNILPVQPQYKSLMLNVQPQISNRDQGQTATVKSQ